MQNIETIEDYLDILNMFEDEPRIIRHLDIVSYGRKHTPEYIYPKAIEDKYDDILLTLDEALKDKPKDFVDYICNDKELFELDRNELTDAWKQFDEFTYLNWFFVHIWKRLEHDRNNTLEIEDFTYQFPINQTFLIRKTLSRNGKAETRLVRKEYTHPFENINLELLKKCERCEQIFYAKKNDDRIKFCSTTCSNAKRQEKFQTKKKKGKK